MEYLQAFFNWLNIEQENIWIAQVFIIVFATLSISVLQRHVFLRIQRKLEATENLWDDLVITAAHKPVTWLIWLIGILFAAQIVQHYSNDSAIFEFIDPVRDVGVVSILIYFLLQLTRGTERILLKNQSATDEQSLDEHTVQAIGKLVRLSIFITGGLIMLQTLGYSISGILALGGVGGIAIGFAAKDLLANFFGGLMIYLDRPFKVGDWIRSNDKDIEGTVEHIGWRLTCIRTFDKRPLYVPNSVFTTIGIENPSRMTNRRIYETMGIRYDDIGKMSVIVDQVRTMLLNHPEIDTDNTLIVNFNSFASSSVDFFVYTFTKTTNWVHFHEVKQDVLLKIVDIVLKNDAEFAFPTSTLHLQTVPEPMLSDFNGQEKLKMADKLLVVMANVDVSRPAEILPPLLQATVAAAMEYEVEVLLTGQAGQLAMKGEAEKLVLKEDDSKTVYDHIKQAKKAGVVFKICTPAFKFWGENLIPEISETVGGAYIINEAMDDSVVTFNY